MCYLLVQTGKIVAYYQYSGSLLVKILVFDPPGDPIYRVTTNCYPINVEDMEIELDDLVDVFANLFQ